MATAAITTAGVPHGMGAQAAADPAPASAARSVTLLTGDRVQLGAGQQVRVQPAPGRERTTFSQRIVDGQVYVVPGDARLLVAAGKLDRQLFNVTGLLAAGYDDSSRPNLPLIVSYGQARTASASVLRSGGARVVRELSSIDGAAVEADKRTAAQFWAGLRGPGANQPRAFEAGVERIWLDARVHATLEQSVPQIGAPEAWKAGFAGQGVTTAVLDTGIDATHPDLAKAVTEAVDFTGSASGAADKHGHGTHVASTITGSGAASGGKYTGVAPDTTLAIGKVLNDNGSGATSWIIAGMEWAAAKARVINMSLGSSLPDNGSNPMSLAVNRLTAQFGSLFVVSAGNSGPGAETIGAPASADEALTVGAVDKQEALAGFSSRGPRPGDQALKPEITGPGVAIVAARAKDTGIGKPVGDSYTTLSGTSMASPHVAGAAAIVAGQHPEWKAAQVKAALTGSAALNSALTVDQQGAGRVDVARAVTQGVHTSPATISNGVAQWPHQDDQQIPTTLTYHNSRNTPLTLDLASDVRDSAGRPAPAGMFTVKPRQVTVPAGGTATATVTTDTRVPGPDDRYTGAVTATGGTASVRTPIGVTKEVESYDLTFKSVDLKGNPAAYFAGYLRDINRSKEYDVVGDSGTLTLRVPKGKYYLDSVVYTKVADREYESVLAQEPEVTVHGPVTMVIDSREAKPVANTVDKPTAKVVTATATELKFIRRDSNGGLVYHLTAATGQLIRPSTTTATTGQFEFRSTSRLAEPDGKGGFAGSPYLYNVGWKAAGRVPADGLVRQFATKDLVPVRSEQYSAGRGQIGGRVEGKVTSPLPATISEYYSADLPWNDTFGVFRSENDQLIVVAGAQSRTFTKGRPVVERWNAAVFGPAFPTEPDLVNHAIRRDNFLYLNIPMFSDQGLSHWGTSATDTAKTTLTLNGKAVDGYEGEQPGHGEFTVPPTEEAYTLHAEGTRGSVSDLSTKVSTDWTFRSGHTGPAPDRFAAVPLSAVRFEPSLDQQNRAPAGLPFAFPVYVQTNGTAAPVQPEQLTVQVSYDDGKTWKDPILTPLGDRYLATVFHPAGSGYVSLKASARTKDGNTVDQTIIRAYAFK